MLLKHLLYCSLGRLTGSKMLSTILKQLLVIQVPQTLPFDHSALPQLVFLFHFLQSSLITCAADPYSFHFCHETINIFTLNLITGHANLVRASGNFLLSFKCTNVSCASKETGYKTCLLPYSPSSLFCVSQLLQYIDFNKVLFFKRPTQLLQVQVPKWTDTEPKLLY